jgi:hypothetical protein
MQAGKLDPTTRITTTDRTLVRDAEELKGTQHADIRDAFGHLSVGELRFAFNGLTVDEIAALAKPDRAQFIDGFVQSRRGTIDSVDAVQLALILGFTGDLPGVSFKRIAANAELIGLSKKDIEGASAETIRQLGAEYVSTASTSELRELALSYLARETEALFAEIKGSIKPTALGQWSKTPNSTFVISQLPYADAINRALDVGFEADRLGKVDAAIALYQSVLAADPENADALNRLSIAYGHKAKSLVTTSDDNKRPSGPQRVQPDEVLEYAQKSLAYAERILANAESAGIYDPIANRISLPELRKLAGNPDLQGLVGATVKALYNRAFATVKLRHYMGVDPFTDGKGDNKSYLIETLMKGGLTRSQVYDYFAHGISPPTAKKALAQLLDIPSKYAPPNLEQAVDLLREIAALPFKISRSEFEELATRYIGTEPRIGFPTADQTLETMRDVRELSHDFTAREKETKYVHGDSAWAAMDSASVEGLYQRMLGWITGLSEKQSGRRFRSPARLLLLGN